MKKVLAVLAPGFEEIEAITVIDILRRAGIETTVAGLDEELVCGSHQIRIRCDAMLDGINTENYSHLFLPGGQPGTENLKKDKRVLELVSAFNKANKIIAAICAAPTVLHQAGILHGRQVTSYPAERERLTGSSYRDDSVVRDKNIITSRGVGTAIDFALTLVEDICGTKVRADLAEKILWSERSD
jgi:protein deglycase